MVSQDFQAKVYTPEQVAQMLQLSKNTIYGLINRGEIIAKRIGKVYRIPASSISFALTGLDYDLLKAQEEDIKNIGEIEKTLDQIRSENWSKISPKK